MAESPEDALLREKVIETLKTVKDPEIPVNIYDLGLIIEIEIAPFSIINVKMTLTAPACPVADSIVAEVQDKLNSIPEASGAYVELIWEPVWTRERMSEEARLELNLD